jgi:hypothetical protein
VRIFMCHQFKAHLQYASIWQCQKPLSSLDTICFKLLGLCEKYHHSQL